MTPAIIVIGASLGGLKVLETLVAPLSDSLPCPLIIVQHRTKDDQGLLSEVLQRKCKMVVKDAEDKEPITPGRIYVAPADYHLLIENGKFCLSLEPPLWYARPAIDVTLESAAQAYGEKAVGIILTGLGEDGAQGASIVQHNGGLIIVQDPKTSEAASMPEATMKGCDVKVLSIPEIAAFLAALCQQ
jgi:two-component system chemotaxis response regulator CheB